MTGEPRSHNVGEEIRVRRATPDDAADVARLLHDFNTEYDEESPGVAVLTERVRPRLAALGVSLPAAA